MAMYGKPMAEVISMSYVATEMKERFETLSVDLKNEILDRNVDILTVHDLYRVLAAIVAEG